MVILERDQIGSGASTRNGGITSGNLRVSLDKLTKKFGKEKATAFYREGKIAREDLFDFIKTEKLNVTCKIVGEWLEPYARSHLRA